MVAPLFFYRSPSHLGLDWERLGGFEPPKRSQFLTDDQIGTLPHVPPVHTSGHEKRGHQEWAIPPALGLHWFAAAFGTLTGQPAIVDAVTNPTI